MVKYTSQLEIRNWKLKIGIWELKCAVFFFIYLLLLLLFSSDGRRKKEEEEKKKRRRKKKENEVLIPGSQVRYRYYTRWFQVCTVLRYGKSINIILQAVYL